MKIGSYEIEDDGRITVLDEKRFCKFATAEPSQQGRERLSIDKSPSNEDKDHL